MNSYNAIQPIVGIYRQNIHINIIVNLWAYLDLEMLKPEMNDHYWPQNP